MWARPNKFGSIHDTHKSIQDHTRPHMPMAVKGTTRPYEVTQGHWGDTIFPKV